MTTEPITPERLAEIQEEDRSDWHWVPEARRDSAMRGRHDLLAEVDRLCAALAEARREGAIKELRTLAEDLGTRWGPISEVIADRADAIERGE